MPLTRAAAAAEAPPSLLDALARAPVAAALVVAALDQLEDRKALRFVHTQLRDAVGEATTKPRRWTAVTTPPRRWPRLEELNLTNPDSAALEALGAGAQASLRSLRLERPMHGGAELDLPSARVLAAALRRMPALRALELRHLRLSDAAVSELSRASSARDAPQLCALTLRGTGLAPAAARLLAATGWPLEALGLYGNPKLCAAGLAALLAALRRLCLTGRGRHCSISAWGTTASACR
jgi:hypothetical protein